MNAMSKQKSSSSAPTLSPARSGLSAAGLYQLIEQASASGFAKSLRGGIRGGAKMSCPQTWVDEYGTPVPGLKTGPCPCDTPCQRVKNMVAALGPVATTTQTKAVCDRPGLTSGGSPPFPFALCSRHFAEIKGSDDLTALPAEYFALPTLSPQVKSGLRRVRKT